MSNANLEVFKLFWSDIPTLQWTLLHLECILKQMLYKKWHEGIEYVLSSNNTKQMVLSLQSEERSCFIENIIGDPFARDLNKEIQMTLVNSLCNAPYCGSLLIFMLENFEDLTNLDSKKQKKLNLPILNNLIALKRTANPESDDNLIIFEEAWSKCL